MTLNSILNEINDDNEFIKAQTSRFEKFEENLRLIEKTRKCIADANIDSIIK